MSDHSIEAIERRLKSWQKVVETGMPAEYAAGAPKIVAQLEAELRAALGREPIIPLSTDEKKIADQLDQG